MLYSPSCLNELDFIPNLTKSETPNWLISLGSDKYHTDYKISQTLTEIIRAVHTFTKTRRRLAVNSGWACVRKSTQHNVCIYRNLKANECSYVYTEVKANIL